jgi:hypothetical protein
VAGRTTGGKGSTSALVYVDPDSVKALQDLSKVIRASADRKELTKALNKEIRKAAEPMRADIATAAEKLTFRSTSKAGASRARRTGRTLKSGKFKAGRGLRKSISIGVRTQISTGANTAGVRVRLASKDPEVNLLGKRLNQKGRIRHPLFGDKDHWYETTATGSRNWFYDAAYPHRELVSRRIRKVLSDWTTDLARRIDRAA